VSPAVPAAPPLGSVVVIDFAEKTGEPEPIAWWF
jgi:hypothetical protein